MKPVNWVRPVWPVRPVCLGQVGKEATAPALSCMAFFFGFGLNVSQPISMMIMYARSPEGRSGEALGVRFAVDNVTKLCGPVLFGLIASALGVAALFWINALMLGAGGLFVGPAVGGGKKKSKG